MAAGTVMDLPRGDSAPSSNQDRVRDFEQIHCCTPSFGSAPSSIGDDDHRTSE